MKNRLRVQNPDKMTLSERIEDAVTAFERKNGFPPDECVIHPAMLGKHDDGDSIYGCIIRVCPDVSPCTVVMGTEYHEKGVA